MLVLDTHDVTTPMFAEVRVLVEFSSESLAEVLQVSEVLSVDSGEGNTGSILLVDELSKIGFAADKSERNVLSSAKRWEMDNELNWINIVGDNDELSLAFFDESGHVIKTELQVDGLCRLGGTLSFSSLEESLFLLGFGFGRILSEQFKELGGYNK